LNIQKNKDYRFLIKEEEETEIDSVFHRLSSFRIESKIKYHSSLSRLSSAVIPEEEISKILDILMNTDDDPIITQLQTKIASHEKTIEILRSKKRKSRNEIDRMDDAKMKIEELQLQKKQYDTRIK